MNKTRREIECLYRLNELTGQLSDIVLFLKSEGLINDTEVRAVKQSSDYVKEVHTLVKDLHVKGKFQLLEYTWNILPVENISIYIVTDKDQREFIYNG